MDNRFGRHTVAAKMTDVPGHTIGIVAPLAKQGIKYLHIGVNEASAVPAVPELFVWRDCKGNELFVNYSNAYGSVHTVEGLDEALAFAFTGDNLGPCTVEQVHQSLNQFAAMFPGAEVCASTLDSFAKALFKTKDTLPVVTSEIGDTWIHGVGTDPKKVSQYRGLLRLRNQWLYEGWMDEASSEYRSLSEKLLLVPEHTWGMSELSFEERFGMLVDAEWTARHNNHIRRLVKSSGMKSNACVEDIDWDRERNLDRSQILQLSNCTWINQGLNTIITGPTGTGKTWLSCAIGTSACRNGYSTLYIRVPRLLTNLVLSRVTAPTTS